MNLFRKNWAWENTFSSLACAALIIQMACAVGVRSQSVTVFPPVNASSDEAVVMVEAEIVANSARLRVGDIARIVSANEKLRDRLQKIDLGYAPDVGVVRELSLEKIGLAINAAGLPAGTIRVEGSPVVLVRRATQVIDQSYVREAVERAVASDLQATGAAVRLVRLDLPDRIEVPSGATEVRASVGSGRDMFAPFTALIEIMADNQLLRRLSVTAQVEAFAPVLVATRDLAAGARARAEDVRLEPRRLKQNIAKYIRDVKTLRGVVLRRYLASGEPLMKDALVAEMVVKPGDMVRIIGESGLVYIEVKGEARSAGRVGDRIQVKNVQSGILLQCIVEDEGVVRVHF